jgi:hypothetical protein
MARMNSNASKFQTAFVETDSVNRAILIERLKQRNSKNTQIIDLLTSINTNDACVRNNNKPDSIYFISRQLKAIETFKY